MNNITNKYEFRKRITYIERVINTTIVLTIIILILITNILTINIIEILIISIFIKNHMQSAIATFHI